MTSPSEPEPLSAEEMVTLGHDADDINAGAGEQWNHVEKRLILTINSLRLRAEKMDAEIVQLRQVVADTCEIAEGAQNERDTWQTSARQFQRWYDDEHAALAAANLRAERAEKERDGVADRWAALDRTNYGLAHAAEYGVKTLGTVIAADVTHGGTRARIETVRYELLAALTSSEGEQ